MKRRGDVLAEIAREEQRVALLEAELRERNARLEALRTEVAEGTVALTEQSESSSSISPASTTPSNSEKIAVFRSLFRGREDIFARRWENSRTGKSGYAPACSNEWKTGICEKLNAYRVRKKSGMVCARCTHQSFLPITNEEIVCHLKGLQVIGSYPLLVDETCWFLAVDFDKLSWQDDVSAFAETCNSHQVPVYVERSRSGNGGHAWFFFTAPVPATIARAMACFLITDTTSRRHQLSMESYDRLFPNQDTLPKGGFGNLIALPLQRKGREGGNSVFVDASFVPFRDQWSFLAAVKRIENSVVQSIASAAARIGQVVGVSALAYPEDEHGEDNHPWIEPPPSLQQHIKIAEPLPPVVRAVLSQRLFIEKRGLPSPLLNLLKRLASFSNPEFYKKQSMRFSTALTPRIIACGEDLPEYIALPRGCLPEAQTLLKQFNIKLEVDDKRNDGVPLDICFQGQLTPIQLEAAEALLSFDSGLLVAPPGIGKSVIATYLISARKRNTLILVHRKPLLSQWISQLAIFLGISPKDIGQIGGGKATPTGRIDVAMFQSLVRKGVVREQIDRYGYVVVDECHHSPSFGFDKVLSEMSPRYLSGFTATYQRRDGLHPITRMQIGPVRFTIGPKSKGARQPFHHSLIVRKTDFVSRPQSGTPSIQGLYAELAADQVRNDLIFDDVMHALEEKRSPIILTERIEHLQLFALRLKPFTRHLIVLHGRMKPKERHQALEALSIIPEDEERLLLATGKYIGEGFDDARLDTLFLAMPVSWKGTLVQYSGRLHRLHAGKTDVRIYDYVDHKVPIFVKMYDRRLRGYKTIGYTLQESPHLLRSSPTE